MRVKIRKALALSPHTDDSFIGAGGLIYQLSKIGIHVTNMVFTTCDDTLIGTEYEQGEITREDKIASKILGVKEVIHHNFENKMLQTSRQEILDILYPYRNDSELDLVIAPYPLDVHQDHATVAVEAVRAFTRNGVTLIQYPIVGTCKDFNPNLYLPISEEAAEKKIEALSSYKTQFKLRGVWFTPETFKADMMTNGVYVNSTYAEAFILAKGIWSLA